MVLSVGEASWGRGNKVLSCRALRTVADRWQQESQARPRTRLNPFPSSNTPQGDGDGVATTALIFAPATGRAAASRRVPSPERPTFRALACHHKQADEPAEPAHTTSAVSSRNRAVLVSMPGMCSKIQDQWPGCSSSRQVTKMTIHRDTEGVARRCSMNRTAHSTGRR